MKRLNVLLVCFVLTLSNALQEANAASVVLGSAGASGVSANISPDPGDIGRPASIWIGAVLNGRVYLRSGPSNWVEYRGGPYPVALTSSALPSSLHVSIANFDISSLPGLDVYVGYGSTEADLSRSGHLARVYTVPQPQSPAPAPAPSPFEALVGRYVVTYSGGDSGTCNATVTYIAGRPTANASGTCTSLVEGAGSVSGTVSQDGTTTLVVGIAGTGGATFTGRIQNGRVSGTWSNPFFDLSGTFTGTRVGA